MQMMPNTHVCNLPSSSQSRRRLIPPGEKQQPQESSECDVVSLAEEADEYLTIEEDQIAAMRLQIEMQELEIRNLKESNRTMELKLQSASVSQRNRSYKLQKLNQDYALCEERLLAQDSMLRSQQYDVNLAEKDNKLKDKEIDKLKEKLKRLASRNRSTSSGLFAFFSPKRTVSETEEIVPKSV